MGTEPDTYRKFVVPKLQAVGWDTDPHSVAEQRTRCFEPDKKEFFDQFGQEVRTVLDELLEKHLEPDKAQFVLPNVLQVPPISTHSQIRFFGEADQLRNAANQLQTLLDAA